MSKIERKKQIDDQLRAKVVEKYESGKSLKVISEELELKYHSVNSTLNYYIR